jgi:acetamidase/formamidase
MYVEGAQPGDVLEVHVESIDLPIDYGYNGCSGFLPENCDRSVPTKIVPLDRAAMTAEFFPGIVVPLKPFFGSMGVAPPAAVGRVSSNPPSRFAGNMDNRELIAGSTLFIPVFVPGALFAVGDGHAAQGDGEVSQTAIETSLRGRLRLTVRKGEALNWPRAETPTDYISMGADPDLTVATRSPSRVVDFARTRRSETRGVSARERGRARAVTQLVDKPRWRAREGAEACSASGRYRRPAATTPSARMVRTSPGRAVARTQPPA